MYKAAESASRDASSCPQAIEGTGDESEEGTGHTGDHDTLREPEDTTTAGKPNDAHVDAEEPQLTTSLHDIAHPVMGWRRDTARPCRS